MIISKDELRKNIRILYDPDTEELQATIVVKATIGIHHLSVRDIFKSEAEDKLIDYLREKLRNLGGVE